LNTFAVTRPVGEGRDTAQFIREQGWNPLIFHTVELKTKEPSEILSAFNELTREDAPNWLIFMSPRGVNLTLDVLSTQPELVSKIRKQTRLVAVGPKTREALLARGFSNVFLPESYSSVGLAEALMQFSLQGKQIVLARSADADDSLAQSLAANGALVTTVPLYSVAPPRDHSSVLEFVGALRQKQVNGVLFTSSMSVANLFKLTNASVIPSELIRLLESCSIAAIGPVTAKSLQEHGVVVEIVPAQYLINEAISLIVKTWGTTALLS
jgi:uroporphyrinogen-III synthase